MGAFIPSLITPVILLVLYATFLAKIYHDSFASALPEGFPIADELLNSTVVCQLISSLLAVCCVTVSFCANLTMIGDKASGSIRDFTVTPVKRSTLAIGYFVASALSTLIVSFVALGICLIYLSTQGWYMSFSDVLLVLLDVILLTLFGTSLSSCINFFLSTKGQASAVGTIISSGYGFICGAYMPISNFSEGLQDVLMYLPGTYGTSLLRNHMMNGVFKEMEDIGFPKEVMKGIRDSIDCNIYFNSKSVPVSTMFIILIGSIALFVTVYIVMNALKKKTAK